MYIIGCFFFTQIVEGQTILKFSQPIFTPLRIVGNSFVTELPDSSVRVNADSIMEKMTATPDTIQRPGKSTTVAWVASAIIPGAGQIYNGSYWKAPLIWGLGYYLVSVYLNQNDLYKQNRQLYEAYLDSAAYSQQPKGTFDQDVSHYKEVRDFYKNQRDTFGWYIAITYLINILDAYVDASLYNFEVAPVASNPSEIRFTMKVRFN